MENSNSLRMGNRNRKEKYADDIALVVSSAAP